MIEIDETKFGKRKYSRGRIVEGTWILDGIERETDNCFLVIYPENKRSEATLVYIIKAHVLPETTIITDKLKAYANLDKHGYIHLDVNV